MSDVFRASLDQLRAECEIIRDMRILGVMIGIELAVEGSPVVKACLDRRLLVNCTQGTVIRLLPAMNLPLEAAHDGCDILAETIKQLAATRRRPTNATANVLFSLDGATCVIC